MIVQVPIAEGPIGWTAIEVDPEATVMKLDAVDKSAPLSKSKDKVEVSSHEALLR